MTPENQGFTPEKRSNTEMREELDGLTTYLLEIAKKLDQQLDKNEEMGFDTSHEAETLKTQLSMIQNRIIGCCEGKLRRERANGIFQEISGQVENIQTRDVLLSKVKKGIHDGRE